MTGTLAVKGLSKVKLSSTKKSYTLKIHAGTVLLRRFDSNITKIPNFFNGKLKAIFNKFREKFACFQTKIKLLFCSTDDKFKKIFQKIPVENFKMQPSFSMLNTMVCLNLTFSYSAPCYFKDIFTRAVWNYFYIIEQTDFT